MADRYDPNSPANLDKFDNAGDPSSDTWATLVTHITGYPVPDRNTVFDTLRSGKGGKLFRMDIKERSLGLLVKDSGFLTNKGEDYDIWFFDSGKKRSIMQARIVFEGRVKAGEEIIFAAPGADNVKDAQVREGNEFTDYNKDKMSTIPLARYMNGPRAALLALLNGNTSDARFSNLGVPGGDVVDLKSFNTTGDSFDFAAKFFKDHAVVLKDWEDRFGRDDASWKGEAADVFRSLLTKIRENYDNYVETFNTSPGAGADAGTGATVYSRALSLGRKYLEDSANKLLDAWLAWAKSPYYDPLQVLRYVLDDLAQWVDANNVAKTEIKSYTTRYSTTVSHSPQAGFTQVHPEYGDLTDIANWAKVGDKAVKIWSQGVNEYLGKPAATVQSNLNNNFLKLGNDFSENVPKPKSTSTASQDYQDRKAKAAQDEINKQNEENRKYQEDLREEQRKQREEDKKYQDDLRKEQNQQREEDKKYQDQLREEQRQQQDEARKYQDDLRKEQNQQREEDKKYQDQLREEQRQQQDEAKRLADEQAKAMKESIGGLNGPGPGNEQNLGNLDDLLNRNKPVTESLGLGGANGQGDDQRVPPPAVTSLGALTNLNGPGATNNSPFDDVTQNLGSLGGLNPGGALRTPTGGNTQLDGGKLTTDFPDGSSTSFDPATGRLTTTNPDGSVTTRDLGDGTRVTNPDGSVTALGDNGKLTTTFPDGTVQTVDPATGQATTTDPDGRTTTQNLGSLGDLNSRSNSDLPNNLGDLRDLNSRGGSNLPNDLGDLRDLNSRGDSNLPNDLEDINPDLPVQSETDLGNLDGLNGDRSGLQDSTGGTTKVESDGDISTALRDGSRISFDPDSGMLTSTDAGGNTTTADLTHGAKVTNPDGSVTSLDNGMLTRDLPDGSKQVIDPDTGIATVTDAQGKTEKIDLNGLNSRGENSSSDLLDRLRNREDIGGPGSGPGGGPDGVSRDLSLSDLNLGGGVGATAAGGGPSGTDAFSPDSTATGAAPLSDGAAAAAGTSLAAASGATPGAPGAPGMPGSPGMPMGGMGAGGMGGGADRGNGERVRAVLVDAAEESERRNRRRRSAWNRQEDDDSFLAPASRVSTTGGAPSEEAEEETGRRATSSADYLEEDADVWGTDEGGTPAVIGR
ncbi:hypothetical protein SZN_26376 [Streptomyces zinciresistens K42]|uniref:POLO box domain-containing protein n=1 Tax=Streptomyces zinciresistens K42 TaxID=700597 RepID=G2GID5_9ACTN|nr:AAWKG family protein [Streptomyces zinciresistens]EGX56728.1 hypothetical protein SZN_26376 [Streptomyces zinciresistens K42]